MLQAASIGPRRPSRPAAAGERQRAICGAAGRAPRFQFVVVDDAQRPLHNWNPQVEMADAEAAPAPVAAIETREGYRNLTEDGGVQLKTLSEGTGAQPKEGEEVVGERQC